MATTSLSRRNFLGTLGLAAGSLSVVRGMSFATADTPRPNIIIILVDDLGYGDLSSYGAKDLKTPHIDQLMADGMKFTNFYANCPVCSPTRAALLTGCYPDAVGVPGVIRTHREDSWGHLSPEAVLLPTPLKSVGYHTAIVGKWHLGLESPNTPNERGFDHFHGYLGDMMDDYYTHRRWGHNYMNLNGKEIDPEGHATDLFTQWSQDYIKEQAEKQQPFFLYLAYNAPHTPIQPPEDWLKKVEQREKNISKKRAKLVALIEHMDHGIGQVVDTVKQSGIADNTLVVFVSDNGGQLSAGANNGDLTLGKQDMYEGGIKVPMCAVWPGTIEAGTTCDRVALTMDIYPTVTDAAGIEFKNRIDGRSILPTLQGKDQGPEDRILFWMRREGNMRYGGRAYYAARQGDYKLLQNTPYEPMKLYNLKDDPKEEHPLPEKHKMYKQLFMALKDHISEVGTVPWQRPGE